VTAGRLPRSLGNIRKVRPAEPEPCPACLSPSSVPVRAAWTPTQAVKGAVQARTSTTDGVCDIPPRFDCRRTGCFVRPRAGKESAGLEGIRCDGPAQGPGGRVRRRAQGEAHDLPLCPGGEVGPPDGSVRAEVGRDLAEEGPRLAGRGRVADRPPEPDHRVVAPRPTIVALPEDSSH